MMKIYVEARDLVVRIPVDVARGLVLEAKCRVGDTHTVNLYLEEFFNELRGAVLGSERR